MIKLFILIVCAILMSCSSLEHRTLGEVKSPGYQFSRHLDEKSLEAGFIEKTP